MLYAQNPKMQRTIFMQRSRSPQFCSIGYMFHHIKHREKYFQQYFLKLKILRVFLAHFPTRVAPPQSRPDHGKTCVARNRESWARSAQSRPVIEERRRVNQACLGQSAQAQERGSRSSPLGWGSPSSPWGGGPSGPQGR